MPKEIIILGSTGSIGNTTLKIIRKNKKDFNVKLLSTNNNISTIYLSFDILQIGSLFFFTGGITNPFIFFY